MFLGRQTQRWQNSQIIDATTRMRIMLFESARLEKLLRVLAMFLGYPIVLLGALLAVYVAYQNIPDHLGFILDLIATAGVAIGCFFVVVRKLVSKDRSFYLSLASFLLGSGLLIAAILIESLSPYRSLLIWASLIVFSTLVAKKYFKVLLAATAVYLIFLGVVQMWLLSGTELDPYVGTALVIALVAPVLLLIGWVFRTVGRLLRWFWKSRLVTYVLAVLASFYREICEFIYRMKIRIRAWRIWTGLARRRVLFTFAALTLAAMLRKHFSPIDLILAESHKVYMYSALGVWAVMLSLLHKEKYGFSMMFTFVGSTEVLIRIAKFRVTGAVLALDESGYHEGGFGLAIGSLVMASWLSRKFTDRKKRSSELLNLGPLGWLVATALIALY